METSQDKIQRNAKDHGGEKPQGEEKSQDQGKDQDKKKDQGKEKVKGKTGLEKANSGKNLPEKDIDPGEQRHGDVEKRERKERRSKDSCEHASAIYVSICGTITI